MARNVKKLAEAIGAKVVTPVPETGGGAFGAARLVAALRERLVPGPGDREDQRQDGAGKVERASVGLTPTSARRTSASFVRRGERHRMGCQEGRPVSHVNSVYEAFCTKRFPLPSEHQVAAVEKQFGMVLPPDYRAFVLNFNGGWFDEPGIQLAGEAEPFDRLTHLAGIGDPKASDELGSPTSIYNPTFFEENDPPQLLPIGYTLRSLLWLVVDPKAEDYGWVGLKFAFSSDSILLAPGIVEFFGLLPARRTM